MQLIAMHHLTKSFQFIEGFSEQYKCIVYWRLNRNFINDADGLQLLQSPFFDYTSENRVPKYTKPFN